MTSAMLNGALLLGLLGLLGMTWLFPLLGRAVAWVAERRRASAALLPGSARVSPRKVAVLVPAHNEEASLPGSIGSMVRAIRFASRKFSQVEFVVRVGADGCSDGSARVARDLGAEVIEFDPNQGKWRTLVELVRASADADWVVLGDAGIAWPEDFLVNSLPLCADARTIAVAPTYRNPQAGSIERVLWAFERHLKSIESAAGGPVSIHGATVMYRRAELMAALDELGLAPWLNDDVVVPLSLRLLFPQARIRYAPEVGVHDGGQEAALAAQGKAPPREFGRRRRMVMGNIQWIRAILPRLWGQSATAAVLALRRVFRVFWAYWALLVGVAALAAACSLAGNALPVAVAAAGLAALMISPLRRSLLGLADAAFASLSAPYYLLTVRTPERAGWR
jgi:hypothetical protein